MYRNSTLCLVVAWAFLAVAIHRCYGIFMVIANNGEGFYIFRHAVQAATWGCIAEWFFMAHAIARDLNVLKKYTYDQFCLPGMKWISFIAGVLCMITAILIFTQVFIIDKADEGSYVFSVILELASWVAISSFFFLWGRHS